MAVALPLPEQTQYSYGLKMLRWRVLRFDDDEQINVVPSSVITVGGGGGK